MNINDDDDDDDDDDDNVIVDVDDDDSGRSDCDVFRCIFDDCLIFINDTCEALSAADCFQ